MSFAIPSAGIAGVRRAMRDLAASRGSAIADCPACGRPVTSRDDAVKFRSDSFHAECALYSPRRRREAP
jgi:hypothetical protein